MNKTPLTRLVLKDSFLFDITDLGNVWMAQIDSFVLIQPKCEAVQYELPFFHCKNPNQINSFTDRSLSTVEDLQEFCKENNIELRFTM